MSNDKTQEPQTHRQLAVDLFNRSWELLDKSVRSDEDNAEMLTVAFASRYHWRQVGDAENFSVSDWQISRVAAVLGYPELAEDYGRRSLHVASLAGLAPFYVGYAHEALARAARLAGNRDAVAEHLEAGFDRLSQVEDAAERDLLSADLKEIAGE
jgi:hypothetical protein